MTVPNEAPAELLSLATQALMAGFRKVSLNFGGLGADFPAPTEWLLFLSPNDESFAAERQEIDYLRISCFREEEPSAYVGHRPELGMTYWNVEQCSEWISSYELEREISNESIELALEAYRNGWTVTVEQKPELRMVSFQFSALNNFYNVEGHPAHRSNGMEVSMNCALGFAQNSSYSYGFLHWLKESRVAPERVIETVKAVAPWWVPVASYDEEEEDWILPEEAQFNGD